MRGSAADRKRMAGGCAGHRPHCLHHVLQVRLLVKVLKPAACVCSFSAYQSAAARMCFSAILCVLYVEELGKVATGNTMLPTFHSLFPLSPSLQAGGSLHSSPVSYLPVRIYPSMVLVVVPSACPHRCRKAFQANRQIYRGELLNPIDLKGGAVLLQQCGHEPSPPTPSTPSTAAVVAYAASLKAFRRGGCAMPAVHRPCAAKLLH